LRLGDDLVGRSRRQEGSFATTLTLGVVDNRGSTHPELEPTLGSSPKRLQPSFAGGDPYRYAFLLVSTNSYADAVRDEVARQAEAFGADLGPEGVFVRANPQRMYDTAEEVLAKWWPDEVRERLEFEADPFIVVIDRPFRIL
jgi:hypothetical protein